MSFSVRFKIPFAKWREDCLRQNETSKQPGELRNEVRKNFSKVFFEDNESAEGNTTIATKFSHNEALAQLIQEMNPCFSNEATHINRFWALNCINGAVEGCENMSFSMLKLLGTFLLSYCSPLEEEPEHMEETEEIVRDAAILCLKSLVELIIDNNGDISNDTDVMRQRVSLAHTGVKKRCDTDKSSGTDYYDYGYSSHTSDDLRGGLSLLPRSRRSLCFDLIQAAVVGVGTSEWNNKRKEDDNIIEELSRFASFAASCLHGESDPRCLMQILSMLNILLKTFEPFFWYKKQAFPTIDIFDAVAPYYPIQFTPPPNDKYGIARSGLRSALMDILSNTNFDNVGDRDSMLNLASGIILERLIPASDDVSRTEEKLEAINDLNTLLHNRSSSLSPESVREISNALMAAHSEGASGVVLRKTGPQKALADTCRTLASKVAVELEASDLWDIFVREPIENDSVILANSPQSIKGRSTIAYFACLAASGGHRSLQISFERCLPHLMKVLKEEIGNEDKISAAAHGVGAFFSSFQIAWDRSDIKISLHPHPLEKYSASILKILVDLFEPSASRSTKISVLRAALPLVITTPEHVLEEKDVQIVIKFIESLHTLVIEYKIEDELQVTAAETLGSIIGVADQEDSSSVLHTSQLVRDCVFNSFFTDLLSSMMVSSSSGAQVASIARACEYSENVSDRVLNELSSVLLKKLSVGEKHYALTISKLIATILKEGDVNARKSFHKTKVDPIEIIKILGREKEETNNSGGMAEVGIALLELPKTEKELEEEEEMTCYGHQIVLQFLLAYENSMPNNRLKSLFDFICHVLPPLTDCESVQLSICLPLFAKMLQKSDLSNDMKMKISAMIEPLTELAIGEEINTRARSEAASSLFWIIYQHQNEKEKECLSKIALQESIIPGVLNRLDSIDKTKAEFYEENVDAIRNSLSLFALMGSAAGCRGLSSTKVSDDIAKSLVELTLFGKTVIPFGFQKQLSFQSSSHIQTVLQLVAASAYSTMISCDTGGPFWRQRILHMALKAATQAVSANSSSIDDSSFWGHLALVTHIAIKVKTYTLSDTVMSMLSSSLARGILLIFPRNADQMKLLLRSPDIYAMQELVLAATIRLTGSFPNKMIKYIGIHVPIMLRILSQESSSIDLKILALQLLSIICEKVSETKVLLKFKPALESTLCDFLDHSSLMLRQMVVETRNHWTIL